MLPELRFRAGRLDVRAARDKITTGEKRPWMRQCASIIGGVLLGNFFLSLVTDLPAKNSQAFALNAVLAILD